MENQNKVRADLRQLKPFFIVAFVGFIYHLRIRPMAGDDVFFSQATSELGLWNYLIQRYETWTSRFVIEFLLVWIIKYPILWRLIDLALFISFPVLISKIFDAVSDVAMGYIEERFAKPHAKARPWIKRMVVPYAASALLLFAVPEFNSTALQALYVFLTYNLFCTIYTMIVIPYNSLQALITQNEKDREMTGVLRSVFSTIASTIVNSFTMTFVEAAGNTKQSWLIVIGAYAVIALAVYVLCYKNTTERVVETKSAEGKEEKLGLKQSLQYVLENKYWWILTINGIVSSAVIALNMGSMFYYLAYVCQKPQSVAVVGMILSMPMLFLIPLSKPIVAKIGMKNGLVAGVLIMALGRVVVGLGGSASLSAIYLGSILFAVGCSTQWCSYPLLCNTVEYGEWKNGHRQEGMIMSANSFGSKCGTAVGTALCGWILQFSGYDGAAQVQSASALTGITVVYVVLPIVLNLFSAVILSFYKLEKEYPTIVKELQERKQGE